MGFNLKHFLRDALSHHDGEDDGSHSGLQDPEDGQTRHLYQREEVNAPQRDVTQERKIRLVFGWHQIKLYPFPKLNEIRVYGSSKLCHKAIYTEHN